VESAPQRGAAQRVGTGSLSALALTAVVVLALALFTQAGSAGRSSSAAPAAARAGGQHECPPVHGPQWIFPSSTMKATSDQYELFATGISCTDAAAWMRRLATKKLASTVGNASSLSGPSGFTCYGYPDLHGRAYAGSCTSGGSIFGWNFNQLTIPAYTEPGLPKTLGGGTDAEGSLTALGGGRYRLTLRNISTKGTINSFTWTPTGMTITALTSTRGGACRVTSDGGISCKGRLRQPKCLCDGSGGALTVVFSARRDPGDKGGLSVDGRSVHITSLTPVPHIVPSTKQAQATGNV
jgi:hypothetical protein